MHFYVTFNCSFITTANGSNIGIWYVDDGTGNCVEWEEGTIDSYAKGAQSALTIATIAGFTAGVLVTFEWLICEVCCAGCVEGLAFAFAWLSGGAVFTIYGTCSIFFLVYSSTVSMTQCWCLSHLFFRHPRMR